MIIKFPFKRKGLISHNVKFLKGLVENNNGQFKVDNKSTILHLLTIRKALHRSETTTYNMSCYGHGSFSPSRVIPA